MRPRSASVPGTVQSRMTAESIPTNMGVWKRVLKMSAKALRITHQRCRRFPSRKEASSQGIRCVPSGVPKGAHPRGEGLGSPLQQRKCSQRGEGHVIGGCRGSPLTTWLPDWMGRAPLLVWKSLKYHCSERALKTAKPKMKRFREEFWSVYCSWETPTDAMRPSVQQKIPETIGQGIAANRAPNLPDGERGGGVERGSRWVSLA